jgi:serine protease Do
MKRVILAVAVGLMGCAAEPVRVEQKVVEIHITLPDTGKPEAQNVEGSHLENFASGMICSGEFVTGHGDVLTARHCVEEGGTFDVITYDGHHYVGTVVAISPIHDLALIHIDRVNTPYFHIAQVVTRGDSVSILGSPLGITDILSQGYVARLGGDVTFLDAGALPGNSGGPVFNSDGELVGVLTAGYIVMFGTTHLNIAQSHTAVEGFLLHALRR